jgi:hypothetical protein
MFQKGKSGNPAGRPRGIRNKSSILLENVMQGDTEAVARMLTAMTRGGKIVSLRVCMQPKPAGQTDTSDESTEAGREPLSARCISR